MAVHDMLMAAAGGTAGAVNYIDDVFSTYLYTGNDSTQTITNGIDLSTKGGLVWIKDRTTSNNHVLTDTARGNTKILYSNSTTAELTTSNGIQSFNTNGFGIGPAGAINTISDNFVSWTFAKQAKFFDVVTYTGTGSARTVAHNLGSAPGTIIVKRTDATESWFIYHRSTGAAEYLTFNTSSSSSSTTIWNNTSPTSSVFSLGATTAVNANGGTYVAYLFAHDAGGFGTAGTDNVISCGSFTTDATTGYAIVNLGYEPQYLLVKGASVGSSWFILDVMRGFSMTLDKYLAAESSISEQSLSNPTWWTPTATGFNQNENIFGTGQQVIYIAIRRPMKPPTTGTEVFSPNAYTGTGSAIVTTGFPVDLTINKRRDASDGTWFVDRLRTYPSNSTNTNAEIAVSSLYSFTSNTSFTDSNHGAGTVASWNFRRAPGFFDVVCWTADNTWSNIAHNLGVTPELIITKSRNYSDVWFVDRPNQNGYTGELNNSNVWYNNWGSGNPVATSTTFEKTWDVSGRTVVAYLFASCPGVSKVGTYTGNGTSQQINCGFSSGARFVMVKRTDSTGDWYVWDSARGIVSGNDPYLLMNSTAAEVTSTDYIDPYSAGFEISSTAPAAINASGGTYIYLAIA